MLWLKCFCFCFLFSSTERLISWSGKIKEPKEPDPPRGGEFKTRKLVLDPFFFPGLTNSRCFSWQAEGTGRRQLVYLSMDD